MTILPFTTERLIVRNWRDEDRDLFHAINSDERVMKFFPFRRDRAQSDELMYRLAGEIAVSGFGFAALQLRETGECLGFTGIAHAFLPELMPVGTIEIGWRLHYPFWGKGYATEAARAWLGIGFDVLGKEEIVSFAVHDNHASTAVMERIGMRRDASRDFDHPRVPDTHPHQKHHVFYALTRDEWLARQ